MATGERTELLLVTAELCGSHEFTYQAANIRDIAMLQARACYVRKLQENMLAELSRKLEAKAVRLVDYAGSRAYICFATSSAVDDASLGEIVSLFSQQTNEKLLDKYRKQLYFCVAASRVECMNDEISRAIELTSMRLNKEINSLAREPFRRQLNQAFETTKSYENECKLCRADQPEMSIRSYQGSELSVCSICAEIIDNFFGRNAEVESHATIEEDRSSVLESIPSPTLWKETEYSHELKSVFHFKINSADLISTSAHRLQARITSERDAAIVPFSEIQTILERSIGLVVHEARKQHSFIAYESDFGIIQCDSRDVIVCGKFFPLLDLALQFEDLLRKKYPQLSSYAAGVSNGKASSPMLPRLRQVFQMTDQPQSRNGYLAVNFSGDITEFSAFTFEQWRGRISNLLTQIRSFESMNALGFNFWDYVFDKARSDSTTIYDLMYKIARREESHSELQKNHKWRQFKKELFLALSSHSAEQKQAREILITALSWHLYFKDLQHFHPAKKELIQLGR